MNKRQYKKRMKKVIEANCDVWSKYLSELTGQSICIDPRGVIVNPTMIQIRPRIDSIPLLGEFQEDA